MTLIRSLLIALLLALPCSAEWSAQEKGWALCTSAILTQMANYPHDALFGAEPSASVKLAAFGMLHQSWGIYTRAQLLRTIHDLTDGDQDPGAATAFIAWHYLRLALGEKGARVKEGELYDAVFEIARRMQVHMRRLYIQPEKVGPRVAPSVGSKGDLMIPERLLKAASRREINGIVAYELMLIKNRHLYAIWNAVIPMLVVLIWRAYLHQTAPSENVALLREAGIMMSAFGVFRKSLREVQSGAVKAFIAADGDGEACIAGLARLARLAGSKLSLASFEGMAKRCGIAQDRLPALMETGLPETGHYPIPYLQRDKLHLLP